MKLAVWKNTVIFGVFIAVYGSNVLAADASFSFAPAPANLSGNINKDKLGIDVVNVEIEGGSSISATTFRYLFKRGQENPQNDKKSIQGFSFYFTSMESDAFDSANAMGMEFDGVGGSATGAAFIFSSGADLQFFSTSFASVTTDIMNLLWHIDFGLQDHLVLGPNLSLVPWGKYSYYNVSSSISVETPYSFNYYDSNTNFSSLSYGFDMMFNGFSLGAMYQQADNASLTKLSFSFDF